MSKNSKKRIARKQAMLVGQPDSRSLREEVNQYIATLIRQARVDLNGRPGTGPRAVTVISASRDRLAEVLSAVEGQIAAKERADGFEALKNGLLLEVARVTDRRLYRIPEQHFIKATRG